MKHPAVESQKLQQQRGFTLVEVMLVVIIIGVLSGISIPSFVESIRRDRIKVAADGVASFLQEAAVEAKKSRRSHSVLFEKGGATIFQSDNCTGAAKSHFQFEEINAAAFLDGGASLGTAGLPPATAAWGLYGGAAAVGDGWKVDGRNCLLFPAIPSAFGNTAAPGGVLIRYQNNNNYGAWIFKLPNKNHFVAYVKEGEQWTQR